MIVLIKTKKEIKHRTDIKKNKHKIVGSSLFTTLTFPTRFCDHVWLEGGNLGECNIAEGQLWFFGGKEEKEKEKKEEKKTESW